MPRHTALSDPGQFSPERLTVNEPEKTDGKRVSVIGWDGGPLYVQSPKCKVHSHEDGILSLDVGAGAYKDLLRSVEAAILQQVSDRSADFFGNFFPLENVTQRHTPLFRDDTVLRLTVGTDTIIRNQYGAEKTLADLSAGTEASFFAHVHSVVFGKRSSEISVSALQVKMHMNARPQEWLMEETVTVPDPVEPDEISEEINDAKPLNDDYFDDLAE